MLIAIFKAWRPSLFAGFMGALASQFWFLAFALATAASVRTLALVEVLFAQAISRFVFGQPTSRARGDRHRADRRRRRAADVGVLKTAPAQHFGGAALRPSVSGWILSERVNRPVVT